MTYRLDHAGQQRLHAYMDGIGDLLGNKCRKSSFAMYALGIMGDGERKSAEPIASRASADEGRVRNAHQKVLHFLRISAWSDADVRRYGVDYALAALRDRGERIETWVFDDTGFLKQGEHSPCVQRQYTGSAGKRANCQIAVSLTVCTKTEHVPVDMELYVPTAWANDRARRREAKIPDDIEYRPKWQMALDMALRALRSGVPGGIVLADSAYGDAVEFRDGIRAMGLAYAVDVKSHTHVRRALGEGRYGQTQSVLELAQSLKKSAFARVRWRDGTRRVMASRFATVRVQVQHSDGQWRPDEWLLIEWPAGEAAPTHFVLSTVDERIKRVALVRIVKQRWRIEPSYEDMKGELGLDHFEGRTWPGWNHHVSVVLCCYAFIVAEMARHFPPAQARQEEHHSLPLAA